MNPPNIQQKSNRSTYNVQLKDIIIVIEASGCSISHHGALIFTNSAGRVIRVYNKDQWLEAWMV